MTVSKRYRNRGLLGLWFYLSKHLKCLDRHKHSFLAVFSRNLWKWFFISANTVLTALVCKPMTSYEEGSQQFPSLKSSVVTIFTVKRNIKKLHFVYLFCRIYVMRMLFTKNRISPFPCSANRLVFPYWKHTFFVRKEMNIQGNIALLIVLCILFITFLANVSSVSVIIS